MGAVKVELTTHGLGEIDRAAASIQIEGERYPEHLRKTVGHWMTGHLVSLVSRTLFGGIVAVAITGCGPKPTPPPPAGGGSVTWSRKTTRKASW